jgi:hypothetical protein
MSVVDVAVAAGAAARDGDCDAMAWTDWPSSCWLARAAHKRAVHWSGMDSRPLPATAVSDCSSFGSRSCSCCLN